MKFLNWVTLKEAVSTDGLDLRAAAMRSQSGENEGDFAGIRDGSDVHVKVKVETFHRNRCVKVRKSSGSVELIGFQNS